MERERRKRMREGERKKREREHLGGRNRIQSGLVLICGPFLV